MNGDLGIEGLDVVGTTVIAGADDLPIRLSPIFRRRGTSEYLLPLDDEAGPRPRLAVLDQGWFDDRRDQGAILTFSEVLAARPGCWLIQMTFGAPPEYLPAALVADRMRRAQSTALSDAVRCLVANDPAGAEKHVWYAGRARHDDPLPLLPLIALLRREMPEEVRLLEEDLRAFDADQVRDAKRRLERDPDLGPLTDLARRDPIWERVLSRPPTRPWMGADSPANRDFLHRQQRRIMQAAPSSH